MQEQKYIVMVTDHARTGEPDGQYQKGIFESFEEAVSVCKQIIEESLDELYSDGMNQDELMKQFMMFGLEAYCERFDSFSFAKEYALKRCLNI